MTEKEIDSRTDVRVGGSLESVQLQETEAGRVEKSRDKAHGVDLFSILGLDAQSG